jgi:branched-chain amino acid transport system permease protein
VIKDPAIRRQLMWLILPALLLVLVAPLVLDTYTINILIRALFFAMLALTVDVLWGYTGYLTFGQSAFFGAGAYAAGLVFTHLGFGPGYVLLAAFLAVVAALLIGLITGWLSFYHGSTPLYASVISLVLPIVLTQVLFSGGTFTGSSSGLTGYEAPDLELETWFRLVGSALVVLTAFTCLFLRSDGGRILSAIRDNETRCSYLGIDISRYKIYLLIATGIIASLAGFGYASFSGVVAPELAGFVFGTEVIIWVALGGRGTIMGPVLGAVLIDWSSAYLSGNLPYVWKLFLGIAFVLVIVLLPKGLLPAILKWFRKINDATQQPKTVRLVLADTTQPAGLYTGLAIELKGVAKSFGSLNVLSDITFSARAGELVSLIGPNGAGKTTLMRCISDGAERGGGTIYIQGHDIKLAPPHQCVQFGLGRKFQTATVFDSLTVAECLRIARTRIETPSFSTRSTELHLPSYALEVLRATELDQKLDVVTNTLSHGEKQALELAMVLALEPRVVLLDEPTAGLSQSERSLIGRILVDLTSRFGLCLLLVEHDLDFVREISSRIVVLHQGRLVMEGTVREVVDSDLVKTIYSGSLGHA